MTTTTTIAGVLLLLGVIGHLIGSVSSNDENKKNFYGISADVYFVGFVLLVALYCNKPKEVKVKEVIHDTIFTHAPTGEEVIPAYNPTIKNK